MCDAGRRSGYLVARVRANAIFIGLVMIKVQVASCVQHLNAGERLRQKSGHLATRRATTYISACADRKLAVHTSVHVATVKYE